MTLSNENLNEKRFYVSVVNSSRRNVLNEGRGTVCPQFCMYVGRMYVVCNHAPGPSVLGAPDPRRTETFSAWISMVNILIPSPPTPLAVCRTVP